MNNCLGGCPALAPNRPGGSVAVVDMRAIEPLEVATVVAFARSADTVEAAEHHLIVAGLGSAVAEALTEARVHASVARASARDTLAVRRSTLFLFEEHGPAVAANVAAFDRMRGQV